MDRHSKKNQTAKQMWRGAHHKELASTGGFIATQETVRCCH